MIRNHKDAWIQAIATIVGAIIGVAATIGASVAAPGKVPGLAQPTATVTRTIVPSPSGSTPAPISTPNPTLAPASAEVALSKFPEENISGSGTPGSYRLKGQDYTESIALRLGSVGRPTQGEYTLTSPYRSFKATAGVNDRQSTSLVIQFAVYGNGKLLGEKKSAAYSKPVEFELDISGMQKLTLEATRVSGDFSGTDPSAIFGYARVLP
jgi:hypothetical protein